MDTARESLFSAGRVARLATTRPDGSPHLVPVVFALVGDVVWTAVDRKPKTTTALRRLANIGQDSRVSLLVDHYADDWEELWWVRVDGTAEVLDPSSPTARVGVEALSGKYPQYLDLPPDGPVIRVHADRWASWHAR
ncbi:MAG: TIGR03668 family PPOX class F420-dependent oxidoreductase [Actinomycetota bacterium]|nr:TIGR03668 family PPOX class F420-dependent oxidoreductase [Actinomycetota bacterium]